MAEGAWTRNREGWAPTLLEMWGVPYAGSDALALSLSLDKVYTKQVAGVRTPAFSVVAPGQPATAPAAFPPFVKPRYEGTAKGIRPSSVAPDLASLHRVAAQVHSPYQHLSLSPF